MLRRMFLRLAAGLIAPSVGVGSQGLQSLLRKDTQLDDVEDALLGSLMLAPENIPAVVALVHPVPFSQFYKSMVLLEMESLHRRGIPVDLETVANSFASLGLLSYVGGYEGLANMVNSTPNPGNALLYANSLVELSPYGIKS